MILALSADITYINRSMFMGHLYYNCKFSKAQREKQIMQAIIYEARKKVRLRFFSRLTIGPKSVMMITVFFGDSSFEAFIFIETHFNF